MNGWERVLCWGTYTEGGEQRTVFTVLGRWAFAVIPLKGWRGR